MGKFLFAVVFLFSVSVRAQLGPDLILTNGKVFTASADQPRAEAIAIKGERIVAVGSNDAIAKLAAKRTRTIDLQGRIVVPGFNDAHAHFQKAPKSFELKFNSMEPSFAEVIEALRAAVKTVTPGRWIFGTIGGTAFTNAKLDREALDAIAPDHPVLLSTFYGHGTVINSKAMPPLKIAGNTPDPAGGRYEREAGTGKFNGRLLEYAQWNVDRSVADMVPDAEIVGELKKMGGDAAAFGVTTMQIMTTMRIDRFARLLKLADLPIRVRAIPFSLTTHSGRDLTEIKSMARLRSPNRRTTIGGIKWILDGTPFERGASLRQPYADHPTSSGEMNFSTTDVENMLRESLALDQQILFHAVGDQTVQTVFDAMEKVGAGKVDWPSKRVRIEHGEGVTGDLIERAKRLGVIVVQNPSHFSFVEMLHARWSPSSQLGPQRSLLEGGVNYALGSDGPMSPGLNIMFATTYPARPEEAITREQVVTAYTYQAAYSEFAEKEKGMIKAGMLADLAVLSQDIFAVPTQALPGTTSVYTIVGGKIVHDAVRSK